MANVEALKGTHVGGKNQCNLKFSISFIKTVKGTMWEEQG